MTTKNSFSQWLSTSPILSAPRRTTWRVINWLLGQRNMMAVPITDNTYRAVDYSLIRDVISETDMLLLKDEAYQVLSCARATAKVQGDIAEVGVYRGGSARLLCEVFGHQSLY